MARGMARQPTFSESSALCGFEGSHVDGEAVLDIGLEQAVVGLVDFLNGNDFDVGGDVVLTAEVEHLLGLGNAANGRAGKAAAADDQRKSSDGKRFFRRANESEVAIAAKQHQ